jgi:hypothetical protein
LAATLPDALDQSSRTFGQHLLELAETVGLAENADDSGADIASRLPSDESTLDMLKRAWNRGYRSFLAGVDPLMRGRGIYNQWNFLDLVVTLTLDPEGDGPDNIDGDNARYRLPAPITTRPLHAWTLTIEGRSMPRTVEDSTSHRVATLLASLAATGATQYPYISAVRPIPAPEGDAGGAAWEVIVAPRPSAVATMSAQFRIEPRGLVQLDARTVCGAQHDQTILAFAVLEWRLRDAANADVLMIAKQDAAAKLDASIQLDKGMSPRTVGPVVDPGIYAAPTTRAMGRRLSGTNTVYITSGA